MLEEIRNINPTRKDLRKFGISLGIVFTLILSYFFYTQKLKVVWPFIIPTLLLILGIAAPLLLKSSYKVWMTVAIILQWFVTHIILTILFYFIITPVGLLMRLFRKELLSKKFNIIRESYWIKREDNIYRPENYERQF
ncbi:MAG: SxtJ family membrane protein [bacterium]